MSLSIGIVGLPNVGKSTLFNALLKKQAALAANYPFATIEPNVGIVDVPDENLDYLAKVVRLDSAKAGVEDPNIPERIMPATIEFHDIAGLVKGASEGEGLGNKFLSHIREVDAIVQVVRAFEDTNIVREGSVDPLSDIEIINTELIFADISTIEGRISKHEITLKKEKTTENLKKMDLYKKLHAGLVEGILANKIIINEEDLALIKDVNLLTIKPFIFVLNSDEETIEPEKNNFYKSLPDELRNNSLTLCAKPEAELSALDEEEQAEYLAELGIAESGLNKVISASFKILGLQVYYTAGPKEVRAWTIETGTKAPQAAGKIHTDFEKGFIKAMVMSLNDIKAFGSYKKAQEKGKLRMEGKEYVMQVGDIVEFRFNN